MTICPKCGKKYSVTPEVCGECGTVLTDTEFVDPFAEAAKEETALREQARLRREERLSLTAPGALQTKQTERAEDGFFEIDEQTAEASAKNRHTGLRTLAVTAAIAVAAGGGWYGWKRLDRTEKASAAAVDLLYSIDSRPCFFDGRTGRTYTLGEKYKFETVWQDESQYFRTFWSHTVISDDHSRLFYPQFESGSVYFFPYYIDLNSEDAVPQPLFPLKDGGTEDSELNTPVSGYDLLDQSGNSVLLKYPSLSFSFSSSSAPSDSYSVDFDPSDSVTVRNDGDGGSVSFDRRAANLMQLYAVWQDPALHDGNNLGMEKTGFLKVWPAKGEAGAFYALTADDSEAYPVTRINDRTGLENGMRYRLLKIRHNGAETETVSRSVTGTVIGSNPFRFGNEIPELHYLFYSVSLRETKPVLPENAESVLLSRGEYAVTLEKGTFYAASDAALELEEANWEALQQTGRDMLQNIQFEYGTEIRRCDLRTGQDTVIFRKTSEILSLSDETMAAALPNGLLVTSEDGIRYRIHTNDYDEPVTGRIVFYGTETESPQDGEECACKIIPLRTEDIEDLTIADTDGNIFFVSLKDEKTYLLYDGTLFPLNLEGWTDQAAGPTGSGWSTALVNDDETRMLIYNYNGGKEHGYVIDLAALTAPGTLNEYGDPLPVTPILQFGASSSAALAGDSLAVFYENQNENGWMLQIDNNYVSLSAEICADCTAPEDGPAYFFEYGTDSTPDNYLRTLCRYEDGTVTRIADSVDYSSFTLDKKTGSFAFVRQMPDSDYCIFTGDGTSCALEDCTQLTVSPKAPVIYKCNQTIDSVIYD